jgi:hypothetical protein
LPDESLKTAVPGTTENCPIKVLKDQGLRFHHVIFSYESGFPQARTPTTTHDSTIGNVWMESDNELPRGPN